MKRILLSCVTCLLALGLVTACYNEEEEPEEPETGDTSDDSGTQSGGSTETGTVFGFSVDGVMNYIDGGLVEFNGTLQSYEGSVTTDVSDAVRITVEESDVTGAYYLSFDNEGATNWITIVENGTHINLSYSTEKALIYYNAEYGCWGTSDLAYFLCYNSAYDCLYCSALSQYGPDSSSPSPIAALYNAADGKLVTGLNGYEAPAPKEMSITGASVVYVGKTTQLGVEVDDGANPSVTWAITDSDGKETSLATISETGLVTAGDEEATGLVVTATSTLDTSVSAKHELAIIDFIEPDTTSGETYVLGCFVDTEWAYRYFDGGEKSSKLTTTDSWESAAAVYITAQTQDGVDNSCTLAIVVADEATGDGATKLQYITNGDSTNVTLKDDPCLWVYNEEIEAFTEDDLDGRFLVYYTSGQDIRAYTHSDTYLAYPHITAYATSENEPTIPQRPELTGITIEGATSVDEGETIQLTAVLEPVGAEGEVTWTSSDDTKASVSNTGLVTGLNATEEGETITITATSGQISGSIEIVVTCLFPKAEWVSGGTYFFGVRHESTLYYADGGVEDDSHTYCGSTTTNKYVAAQVSVEADESDDGGYYLSYTMGVDTYYITLVQSGQYMNLSLTTTQSLIYYNEDYGTWGDSNATYFLTWYTYSSVVYLYARSIDNFGSYPAAGLYKIPELEEDVTVEVADFETLSSTGVSDGQDHSGIEWTLLTGTTLQTLTSCNIVWDDGTGNGSSNTRVNTNYIQWYGSETITFAPKDTDSHKLVEITIACTSGYAKSVEVSDGAASAEVLGYDISIFDIVDGTQSLTIKNADSSQARIISMTIVYK